MTPLSSANPTIKIHALKVSELFLHLPVKCIPLREWASITQRIQGHGNNAYCFFSFTVLYLIVGCLTKLLNSTTALWNAPSCRHLCIIL